MAGPPKTSTTDAIWLQGIGLFAIVPNYPKDGERDCLFRSISEALTDSKKNPHKIRKQVVAHMVKKKWDVFGPRIIPRWEWRVAIENPRKKMSEKLIKREFAKKMSSADEPATTLELMAAADLYKFHFDYLVNTGKNKAGNFYTFYSCRTTGCNVETDRPIFLFHHSTYVDGNGHWQLIRPLYLQQYQRFPLNRKTFGIRKMLPFSNIDSGTRAQVCEARMEITAKRRLHKCGITIITEEDADWPPDERNDFVGCAGADFKPKPDPTRNPFRILSNRLRTLCGSN